MHKVDNGVKKAELHSAVPIAWHSFVQSIDYLGEIISHHGSGSVWENIKFYPTKCIGLIRNVLSTALKENMEKDIKDKG